MNKTYIVKDIQSKEYLIKSKIHSFGSIKKYIPEEFDSSFQAESAISNMNDLGYLDRMLQIIEIIHVKEMK
jgi:hypothetical protein